MNDRDEIGEHPSVWTKSFVFLLCSAAFYFVNMMMLTPVIAGYTESIGGSGTVMGLSSGIGYITGLFLCPFIGPLLDNFDKKMILNSAFLLLSLSSIGHLFAKEVWPLMLLRILHGVAFVVISTTFSAAIGAVVPNGLMGKGIGIYSLLQAMMLSVSPAVGIYLVDAFDYSAAFFVFAVCAVISLVFSLFISGLSEKGKKRAAPFELRLRNIIAPEAVPFAFAIMCSAAIHYSNSSFLVKYSELSGRTEGVSLFFTICAGMMFIARVLFTPAMNRQPFGNMLMICGPSLFIFLFLVQSAQSKWILWLSAIFLAIGHGVLQTITQIASMGVVGPERRGVASSTFYIGLYAGFSGGPLLSGIVVEAGQLPNLYNYLMIFAALLVFGFVFFRKSYFPDRYIKQEAGAG